MRIWPDLLHVFFMNMYDLSIFHIVIRAMNGEGRIVLFLYWSYYKGFAVWFEPSLFFCSNEYDWCLSIEWLVFLLGCVTQPLSCKIYLVVSKNSYKSMRLLKLLEAKLKPLTSSCIFHSRVSANSTRSIILSSWNISDLPNGVKWLN